MQERVAHIMQWISSHSPILSVSKIPAAGNPFSSITLPEPRHYKGSMRLGFIYQALCKQLFESHSKYKIIAEEVQLRNKKQTLGRVEHWEVALKFYLLKDGLWYGPDGHDRLDKKVRHMVNHQLKMSETEVFKKRFPKMENITPKMLIHGRLYINPFREETIPQTCLEYELDQKALTGKWCFQSQTEQISEPLYMLDKTEWITGRPASRVSLNTVVERTVHCQTESGQFWMVVPDNWPELP